MSSTFSQIKKNLPTLGIGLGLRREIVQETFDNPQHIDWLEFVPENYMCQGGLADERFNQALAQFPLVSHGVNLSIGSTDELSMDYMRALKAILERSNSPWWSDHLCFTSIAGKYMHDLLPLPFTKEAVKHVAEKIKRAQDFVERPFLIENISYYMNMPGCQMTDGQFLAEVVEAADCGIMLDVNNVYVNSINHGFDPITYLNELPLERTVQMHVAGHKRIGEYVIDTHGAVMVEPVFDLLKTVLQRAKVQAVLLERDQNFPPFEELCAELEQIRAIAHEVQPELACRRHVPGAERRSAAPVETRQIKGGRDLRALSA